MRVLLLISAMILSISASAQESVSNPTVPVSKDIDMSSWQTYIETSKIKIEYIKVDCDPNSGMDFRGIMFRFTNLTENELNLNWHIELFYDGTCRTCGYDEYDRSLSLAPNEMKEGDCNVKTNATLDLFVKFIDAAYSKGAELTSFQLNNFTSD